MYVNNSGAKSHHRQESSSVCLLYHRYCVYLLRVRLSAVPDSDQADLEQHDPHQGLNLVAGVGEIRR